jgi:hypothetical protein
MRRASSSECAGEAREEKEQLPSKNVIEMFGRLFGSILLTLFEDKCGSSDGFRRKVSDIDGLIEEFVSRIGSRGGMESGRVSSGCQASFDEEREVSTPATERVRVFSHGDDADAKGREELRELKSVPEGWGTGSECGDRLVQLLSRSTSFLRSDAQYDCHILPYSGRMSFDGIVSLLSRQAGGNAHDKGVISAMGTPADGSACYHPRNVVDFGSNSTYFYSANVEKPPQWMGYDFRDCRVVVTHYLLRSNGDQPGGRHMRSWILEGSMDNTKWDVLDERRDHAALNYVDADFCFETHAAVECKYIRIRPTGVNWQWNYHLHFKAFEVFGALLRPHQ